MVGVVMAWCVGFVLFCLVILLWVVSSLHWWLDLLVWACIIWFRCGVVL